DMKERRQHGKQRVACALRQSHTAAYQSRNGTIAASPKDPMVIRGVVQDKIAEVNHRRRRRVAQCVAVASRRDHEVAGRQWYGLGRTLGLEPATSVSDDMKHRSVAGEAETPRRPQLGPVIEAVPKMNPPQKIAEESISAGINRNPHRTSLRKRPGQA